MKRIMFVLSLWATVCIPPAFAQDLGGLLKERLDALYRRGSEPIVFSYGTFTYADRRLASEFSRYLENNITVAVADCPQFELFARGKLEEILEARELALQDLFSPSNAVRIGNLKAVRAIMDGRFFDAGRNIEVFLELLSVETGAVMGSVKAVIRKTLVPKTVALLPANYNAAMTTFNRINKVAVGVNENLDIKIWTKRGDGGVYRDGEELTVHFIATTDCYIKVYHINVDGGARLIFPNQYHMDNRVRGNEFYSIPDKDAGFGFKLGKPYGTEFIKVVASVTQFRVIEESFSPLGKISRGMITRGLPSTVNGEPVKEALLSYTIIE